MTLQSLNNTQHVSNVFLTDW